jgi:hypothetical protein
VRGAGRTVFGVSPGATVVLSGLTITGGVGNIDDPGYFWGIGGGIYNTGSTLTLNNSTVNGNTAMHGGAIYNHAGGMSTLSNATVSDNRSRFGYVAGILNAGTLQARNTIVAGNAGTDLSGSFSSLGHNVSPERPASTFPPSMRAASTARRNPWPTPAPWRSCRRPVRWIR